VLGQLGDSSLDIALPPAGILLEVLVDDEQGVVAGAPPVISGNDEAGIAPGLEVGGGTTCSPSR
jgi:hypothetical protein